MSPPDETLSELIVVLRVAVTQIDAAKVLYIRKGIEYVYAVHDFGLLLLPIASRYGEATMTQVAVALQRPVRFLYRARGFAEAFPTREALAADIAQKHEHGEPVFLRDYYLNRIAGKAEVRHELVEAKLMEVVEAIETLKATTPEVPAEEVLSLEVIAQETIRDLREHVDTGAEDDYTAWLRSQACIFCQNSPCDVAHLPTSRGAGGWHTLPVCGSEHRRIHQVGLATFLGMDLVGVERVERLLVQMAKLYLACYSRRGSV